MAGHVVLEDENEQQLQQSNRSSTSRSSAIEEEALELEAGGHQSEVECVIQRSPQHLHIDLPMPVPDDEEEDQKEEEEHQPSPLESLNLADEQVSTMSAEDNEDEDFFDTLDEDDNADLFEGVDEAPAESDQDDEEDQIIGMVIQYDITSGMLREGGIPENASRTKLRLLQQTESYEVCLLDSHNIEHSESSSDDSFDFGNLDQFGDFGALDKSKARDERKPEEEDKGTILHPTLYSEEEEIEIVFYGEGEEPEDELISNLDSFYVEDHQDNVEIRFFNCREDEDAGSGSTKFDDCHSKSTSSPDAKIERKHPLRHLIDLEEDEWSLDTPPYEWFLPEHTDIVSPIKHTPKHMVIKKDLVNSRSTPTTLQTVSIQSVSFDEGDHSDRHSLVSHGSAVSEAIQDLVALCKTN